VDQFLLDAELLATLRAIRDSVRRLFEELRLRDEDGDRTGRERLERVPALRKRDFGNLTGDKVHLARKEAWQLIDFLEGAEAAKLSLLARSALRVAELDSKLAALRATDEWRAAAAQLRQALGTERDEADEAGEEGSDGTGRRGETGRTPTTPGHRRRRWARIAIIAGAALGLSAAGFIALWHRGIEPDARYACIALEDATESTLAEHWAAGRESPTGLPDPRHPPSPEIITISDPPGGPVQSTWTSSHFSFAEGPTRPGPGGGRSDFRLRVGGWGDTYLSLLQIPVPTNRPVQRAVVQLTVLGDEAGSRPTTMTLRIIDDSWRVDPGPRNRLWWRDCPLSSAVRNHLPPPGPRGSVYEIDITQFYNLWALGQQPPYGIMLEPEHIGSWRPGSPHYSNFSTFYSTRALDSHDRPRLVLTY